MTSIGTREARTHLTELLERASRGERIVITNRGKPVAILVPPGATAERDTARIGREMLAYRERVRRTLGATAFRDVAHEGHRDLSTLEMGRLEPTTGTHTSNDLAR